MMANRLQEMKVPSSSNLKASLKERCRCCLEVLSPRKGFLAIDVEIRNKFFALTQIALKYSKSYPDRMCSICCRKLECFAKFKEEASAKQRSIYESYPEEEIDEADGNKWDHGSVYNIFVKEEDERNMQPPVTISQYLDPIVDLHVPSVKNEIIEGNDEYLEDVESIEATDAWTNLATPTFTNNDFPDTKAQMESRRARIPKSEENLELMFTQDDRFEEENEKLHRNPDSRKAKLRTTAKPRTKRKRVYEKETFYCKFCQKPFTSKPARDSHELCMHSEKEVENYICEFCSKTLVTKYQLNNHRKSHFERTLKCSFEGCKRTFVFASRLRVHEMSHLKLRNFQCDKCADSYKDKHNLLEHMMSAHLGWRIPCEIQGCSLILRRRRNYRKHLKHVHRKSSDALDAILNRFEYIKP